MMKYKLNIQLFADSTKTVTGDGSKVSTTTYTPNYWQSTSNGSTWYNVRTAQTASSVTDQTNLKNLVNYGAKVNSWTSSSSTSTTYNPITLPEYPTKDSVVKSTSESKRNILIRNILNTDTFTGDDWVYDSTYKQLGTDKSISTTTTYTNYSANGYYTKQTSSAEPVLLTAHRFYMGDNDGDSDQTWIGLLEILATAIDKSNKTVDLSLRFTLAANNNTIARLYGWTPPTNTNWITVGNSDTADATTIETTDLYTFQPGSDPLVLGTFELGTYGYSSDNSMELYILAEWGGYNSDLGPEKQVFCPMATDIDVTYTVTNLDQVNISTEDTYTLVGTAGSSYTPTSSSTQLYTLYDESESTTTTDYSAITLPYITRTGYTLEGFYTTSSFDDGTRIGGQGDGYTPQSILVYLYPKFIANKKIYTKDNGTIKEITSCYYKENGSWVSKTVEEMYDILNNLTYYKDGG